jgi:putative solute:sodium symporter small subunit
MTTTMDEARPATQAARRAAHWQATRKMTYILLWAWGLSGFLSIFFARELYAFSLFGWPLSFYLAAQGSALIYLGIIGLYAWRMQRLDLRYREMDTSQMETNRDADRGPDRDRRRNFR